MKLKDGRVVADARTYIEAHGSVRAITTVAQNAVHYSVEQRVGNEYVPQWSETVFFARDKAHRAAGLAFAQAAREQERRLSDAQRKAVEKADYETTAKGIDG